MSHSTLTIRRLVQRRPLTTASLVGATGLVSYAYAVEYKSHHYSQHELPRVFDYNAIASYWKCRPVSTVQRFCNITYELSPLLASYLYHYKLFAEKNDNVTVEQDLANKLRCALTRLGPAFVKLGQQLSIRPDLVSPIVLKELQKLCDAVEPVSDDVAMASLRKELQIDDITSVFDDLHLVASASLGQVYKGTIRDSNKVVAVKVQRPDMQRSFSLDLFMLQQIGVMVDTFTSIFTNQPPFHQPLYESFSRGSYSELDYENEAMNQDRFRVEFTKRKSPVTIPLVYHDYTTQHVLTTEWIDGVKLADSSQETIRRLIPVGVELFMTQLLDIGAFHADPHPGNLLVTTNGQLCLLDFGLCAEVDEKSRNAMTKAIVHLIYRDFDSLVGQDAKELGFLPHDFDTDELKPLLTKILTVGIVEGGSKQSRRRKLQEISNELNEVFFRYPFSVPPFFALVTRGLGLLEGIALTGDPNFDIFQASVPYARRRAVQILGSNAFRRDLQQSQ